MKKNILLIAAAILVAFNTMAQQANFEAAMGRNLKAMGKATTAEELQESANTFERIASAEQQQWLPLYYAALTYINSSNKEQNNTKKEQYLDKAQQHLDKALQLQPKESELHVLQGYTYLNRISIDPKSRGQKYSMMANESLERAKALNPENPRAYFMLGSSLFHTPKMFGGGPAAAKPLLEQAQAKFAAEKVTSAIAPNWGRQQTEALLAMCK